MSLVIIALLCDFILFPLVDDNHLHVHFITGQQLPFAYSWRGSALRDFTDNFLVSILTFRYKQIEGFLLIISLIR